MGTPPERTTSRLQQSVRDGVAVMIPGAREPRISPAAPHVKSIASAATPHLVVSSTDRGRLQREREGGGSARERDITQPRGLLATIWDRLRHPGR